MPRKHFRKFLPEHQQVREHRYLKHLQPLLKHPNLWHLNRDSVAGGVGIGLFAGMIPGPIQMISAAILSILFRVNLPVAVVATLLTNPVTIGPFIVAAYYVGAFFTGQTVSDIRIPEFDWSQTGWSEAIPKMWEWLLGLGETYLIGAFILGVALGVTGYALVHLGWRLYLLAYLRRRRQRSANVRPVD